ncbi:MAG: hypothetical protein GXO43_02520 [Crenarchaeota archaeon]|nr:hypothetical protein [Thermoproteota archaeon]
MLRINESVWRRRKLEFWDRLWEDLEIGYLDEDLLPVLIYFYIDRGTHTLSSCSGRIILADSTFPWSREETSVVYKKHSPVDTSEIAGIIDKTPVRRLWLNVTGPIIHVSTTSMDIADKILAIARNAGMKHSGILSISENKGIILELTTGVKLTHLLRCKDELITDISKLDKLVEVANQVLYEGKRILCRLFVELRENMPFTPDETIIKDLRRRGLTLEKLFPPSYCRELL